MKTRHLKPTQIITLNDYPLYSNRVFGEYLERCQSGDDLPYVPVIHRDVVRHYLGADLARVLEAFEKQHPDATYVMLDGSHRTTALTFVGRDIAVVLYEADADIVEARAHVASGQILLNGTLDHTLTENCEILRRHFEEQPTFITVLDKTERLIREGLIPVH